MKTLKTRFSICCLTMIKNNYRHQLGSWLLVAITLAILITSFYFEYVQGLNPCPLCLMQRFCVILLLILVCMNVIFKRVSSIKKTLIAQMLVAAAGIFFATRQLWLQTLPAEQIPLCLPGLGMMIPYLPWRDVLHALLLGAGDCAEVTWTLLGLSMPAWAALYFLGMLLATSLSYWHLQKAFSSFSKGSYL